MPSVGGVSAVHLVEDVAVRVNNPDPIPVSISGGGGGAMDVVVTNEVEVKNDAGNPLTVSGTVAATQSGVWSVGRTWNLVNTLDSVNIGNFPATQAVSGTVAVSNFPATQAVSGTVTANAGTGTFTVAGSVSVSNFPATQAVSGSVTVSQATAANLNATVTGTVAATQSGTWNITNITGTVSLPTGAATAAKQLPDNHQVQVSNFPATQAVSGTVNVGNFPATQAVSATDLDIRNLSSAQDSVAVTGTVAVSNFPATQAVSGTVTANLGTLNGAALDTSVQAINGKLPDESGAWGYAAGTSGTATIPANKRVMTLTATAPPLVAATMTINGGATITIPAGAALTILPRANLTAPTLVFTGTASYFVEFIE